MNKLLTCGVLFCCTSVAVAAPWQRHTIDASTEQLRGADGVRLLDANDDGRLDIATGWEESGRIRVCLNPGPQKAHQPWPAVTVGKVPSPEDAVLVDLDGDGAMDVVSCTEGKSKTVFFHRAPSKPGEYLDAMAWRTMTVPATLNQQPFMFALPMDIDGRDGIDLLVGSKGNTAVGWLQAPANAWQVDKWQYHKLCDAGWIMSLVARDMDGDGDPDVLLSDRRGDKTRGVHWLENPGVEPNRKHGPWPRHTLGGRQTENMFLCVADLTGNGNDEVICATRNHKILVFTKNASNGWETQEVPHPFDAPHGKAVAVGDIDRNGRSDIVLSLNNQGDRQQPGVVWLQATEATNVATRWSMHNISGNRGSKFDLVELVDLDHDGDSDVVSCEERDDLGVFWYENPYRRSSR